MKKNRRRDATISHGVSSKRAADTISNLSLLVDKKTFILITEIAKQLTYRAAERILNFSLLVDQNTFILITKIAKQLTYE